MHVHIAARNSKLNGTFMLLICLFQPEYNYSIGGVWTLLYSSSKHGFSMNRFQYHCSDYRDPSVMLLTCRSREGEGPREEHVFAIAVDTDWK